MLLIILIFNLMKYFIILSSIFFLDFIFYTNAFAYIDPGTGSILLQGLIGAIAAGGAAISLYWSKIKAFFTKRKKK